MALTALAPFQASLTGSSFKSRAVFYFLSRGQLHSWQLPSYFFLFFKCPLDKLTSFSFGVLSKYLMFSLCHTKYGQIANPALVFLKLMSESSHYHSI